MWEEAVSGSVWILFREFLSTDLENSRKQKKNINFSPQKFELSTLKILFTMLRVFESWQMDKNEKKESCVSEQFMGFSTSTNFPFPKRKLM